MAYCGQPNPGVPRQGKCGKCKLIFEWEQRSRVRLKDAFCPYCGAKLSQTSRMSRLQRITQDPVVDPRLAVKVNVERLKGSLKDANLTVEQYLASKPTAIIRTLVDHIRWTAQTIHQAYHHEDGQDRKLWSEDCPKNTCDAARAVIATVEDVE